MITMDPSWPWNLWITQIPPSLQGRWKTNSITLAILQMDTTEHSGTVTRILKFNGRQVSKSLGTLWKSQFGWQGQPSKPMAESEMESWLPALAPLPILPFHHYKTLRCPPSKREQHRALVGTVLKWLLHLILGYRIHVNIMNSITTGSYSSQWNRKE